MAKRTLSVLHWVSEWLRLKDTNWQKFIGAKGEDGDMVSLKAIFSESTWHNHFEGDRVQHEVPCQWGHPLSW
jgi:hypothetical protein